MYIDNELLFADGTWAPTATGNNFSPTSHDTSPLGNVINTNTGRDLGIGEAMSLRVLVKVAVTSAGAATVAFSLVTDTVSNMGSFATLATTAAIGKASLTAGTEVYIPLPRGSALTSLWKKWIAVNANIGTAVLTGGAFHCAIVKDGQDNRIYQPGYTVK